MRSARQIGSHGRSARRRQARRPRPGEHRRWAISTATSARDAMTLSGRAHEMVLGRLRTAAASRPRQIVRRSPRRHAEGFRAARRRAPIRAGTCDRPRRSRASAALAIDVEAAASRAACDRPPDARREPVDKRAPSRRPDIDRPDRRRAARATSCARSSAVTRHDADAARRTRPRRSPAAARRTRTRSRRKADELDQREDCAADRRSPSLMRSGRCRATTDALMDDARHAAQNSCSTYLAGPIGGHAAGAPDALPTSRAPTPLDDTGLADASASSTRAASRRARRCDEPEADPDAVRRSRPRATATDADLRRRGRAPGGRTSTRHGKIEHAVRGRATVRAKDDLETLDSDPRLALAAARGPGPRSRPATSSASRWSSCSSRRDLEVRRRRSALPDAPGRRCDPRWRSSTASDGRNDEPGARPSARRAERALSAHESRRNAASMGATPIVPRIARGIWQDAGWKDWNESWGSTPSSRPLTGTSAPPSITRWASSPRWRSA